MAFKFSKRSRGNLVGVHPELVAVAKRAIELTPIDFVITEGVRTKERQRRLLEQGATITMRSRHLTGHAIDVAALVDGAVRWDWPLYSKIAKAFKKAAAEREVAINWGGDWKRFPDGPHFQLCRRKYPA